MAEPARAIRMTYAEYLELERSSEVKHEYVNGEAYAMAGGTPEHGRLAVAMGAILTAALRGRPCASYSSDVRVRIEETRRSTYPDLSVVCGRLERASDDPDAIVNPTVIVEILSDSTEAADRGEKWAHYQRIPSLLEYVLVSQGQRRIEVFRRSEGRWVYEEQRDGGGLRLDSIDVTIDLSELYRDPFAT